MELTNGTHGTDGKQGPQGAQGPKATTAEIAAAGAGIFLPLSGGTMSGNINMGTKDITNVRNITATSSVTAVYGFFETSDENLKEFESDILVELDVLKTLPKKYFRWKSNPESLNIGTSAQAVKKMYPELVSEVNGRLTVDYAKLSVIALAAIDVLNARVKELEEKINDIEK